jgi:quercetin dioxygenase-like cupin family protein
MSWVKEFGGADGTIGWEGVQEQSYAGPKSSGVSVRWLIGPEEGARNFAMRYFEIQSGGYTSRGSHAHDHGVVVLRGRGQVVLGEEVREVSYGDAVYVSPHEVHQFRCVSDEPFGFLCVIRAPEGGET